MANKSIEILLVEDNPRDIELTMYVLTRNHDAESVVVVRDGEEALDFLFGTGSYVGRDVRDRPRVVLLDLKLPKIDGLQVLARVKGDPRTQSIPVVMLTSSREKIDLERSYQLGANSYVVKPVDFDQFTKALNELEAYWLSLNEKPKI